MDLYPSFYLIKISINKKDLEEKDTDYEKNNN